MSSCPFNPASQQYADFLYYYTNQSQPLPNSLLGALCLEYASSYYAVVHVPLESSLPLSFEKYSYYSIPSLFTLLDTSSMEASGIQQVLIPRPWQTGAEGLSSAWRIRGWITPIPFFATRTVPPASCVSGTRLCRRI